MTRPEREYATGDAAGKGGTSARDAVAGGTS